MKKIVSGVILFHGLIILALCAHHFFTQEPARKKIIVRSMPFPPQKKQAPLVKQREALPKKQGTSSSTLALKKKEEKPLAKEFSSTSSTPSGNFRTLPVSPPTQKAELGGKGALKQSGSALLLQKIEEDMAAFENSAKTPLSAQSVLSLPKEIPESSLFTEEEEILSYKESFKESLIVCLQESLCLPEFGDVKIHLKIDCLGHLISFHILETKSKKNEEFLKKQLPELRLPCFNGSKNSKDTHEFTIVFKNLRYQ